VKIAVISVTQKGAQLGEELRDKLDGNIDLFTKDRGALHSEASLYDNLSVLINSIFNKYDGLVFIMAAGIVVRVIAPHVRDKRFDPAVVVMDDAGIHAISLLSGHLGGANELTEKVAEAVGACPVITTATDVAHLPAPDVLSVKLDLGIEPFEELKAVNAAIVAGQRVPFFIDQQLAQAEKYVQGAAEMGVELLDMKELSDLEKYDAAVIITDKELYMPQLHLYLRPTTLSIGIGCRKGTTSGEIWTAVNDACRKIGRSTKSIAIVGSSIVKQEEIGLLAAVEQLEIPIEFYTNEQLQAVIDIYRLDVSKFVEDEIGVGNICEASALLGARASSLLLPKTIYPKVTVAIAEVGLRWWESDQDTP
jgi:cobalt-precorrin 5A hydrolase